jgi:hypothetical protein
MAAKRKKTTKRTGGKKPSRAAKSSRTKPKKSVRKATRKPARKPSRKPTRKPSRKSAKPAKVAKVAKKPAVAPQAVDINQIAQAIANEIKTKNAAPGAPLPVDLLRQLYAPASADEITAALHQLVGQQIVVMQPDGSFVVANVSPGPS